MTTSAWNLSFSGGENCLKSSPVECVPLNGTACFGVGLEYTHTSVDLVNDANSLEGVKKKLLLWSGLTSVPRCWEKIQPLLCSLYLPKCENATIHLPDRTLCQNTRVPCKIVEIENGWPEFMLCDNNNVFADNCPVNFNTKQFNESQCEAPLMATSNPSSWYSDVEGCGLQCMNPLFNQDEHDDMHVFIAVWATITTVCTLFAMLSFFIDWKNSSKYPARIIFYINVCFFICSFGWLAQFFQDARNEIVCRKDGTVRLGEPVGYEESPSCVIIFVLVYFFVMAGVAWFVVLSYSWKAMFAALGTSQEPLRGKTLHFHLFAWAVAFVLLIASLAVSEIDGDSMSGICFIGYKNHWYRMGFLLVPIGFMLFVGGFYLIGGLHCLLSLKQGHDGLLSENAMSKITWTMIRIGLFALFAFVLVFVTFASHVYQIVNQPLWDRSFRDYIRCDANITILEKLREEIHDPAAPGAGGCVIKNRPNIAVMKLHLFAMFGTGIVMSTWVWTKASLMNWRRAWFKLIGRSDNEMKRIRRKSRIIAKAFANRQALRLGRKKQNGNQNEGSDNAGFDPADLEFSEHTLTHQDPVGMDFDLNSVSQELSSNWVRNVPKMVRRRGAIMPQAMSSATPTATPEPPATPGEAPQEREELNLDYVNPRIFGTSGQPDPLATPRRPLRPSNNNSVHSSYVSTRHTQLFSPNINMVDESLPGLIEGGAGPEPIYAQVHKPPSAQAVAPPNDYPPKSPLGKISRPSPSRLPPIKSRRSRPSTRGSVVSRQARFPPTNNAVTKNAW